MTKFLTTPLPPWAYSLAAIVVILIFALRGWRRGVLKEFFGIASLLLSIPLAQPFGIFLHKFFPLESVPEVLQVHAEVAMGGLIAYVLLLTLFFFIRTLINRHWKPDGKAKILFRLGGAIIGSLFAALIIMIIVWFVITMGALSQATIKRNEESATPQVDNEGAQFNELILLPSKIVVAHRDALEKSSIGSIAEKTNPVPESVTTGIDIAAEVMKNPEKLQRLIEHEDIEKIMQQKSVHSFMNNKEIKDLAAQGDIMGIFNHPAAKQMLEDPAIQESLQDIDVEELLRSLEE